MTEMVERVARALYWDRFPDAVDWTDIERLTYFGHARSAIEVMREPTEAMVKAGECEIYEHQAESTQWSVASTKAGWAAMIDAALTAGK